MSIIIIRIYALTIDDINPITSASRPTHINPNSLTHVPPASPT